MRHILLLSTLFLTFSIAVQAQKSNQPNILWITSEDNSASWIGCYGNPYAETPNIDRLADEGFLYTNAYANAPVCSAQRSTWITGILALSMGTHNMRSFYEIPHAGIKYYPDFLNEQGYYTANFDKMDYNISGRDGEACWDNAKTENWEALKNNQPFFQVINLGNSHESKAQGDVENTNHNPENLVVSKYHPDVLDVRKNYAKYYDAIKQMDADVGVKLKKLDEMGLTENTIVIYISDHGGVLPRSKRYLFKNSLHCPLVIRMPERYKSLWPANKPGTKIERMVSFVDMPKTWLSLAGATVPDYMQGTIFLGSKSEPEPQYNFAFRGRMDERIDNARSINDKRFLFIRNYLPYVPWMQKLEYLWEMKATQAWEKEVKEGRANELQSRFFKPKEWTEELYDMHTDPDCTVNLIGSPAHQKVASTMRVQLRKKQLEIYDAGLLPETEMVRLAKENQTTMYEMVRNPKLYDVTALLDAADIALQQNQKNRAKLHEMIEDKHLGIRYWGTVGCFLLNDKEGGLKAINDPSHEIRAMAAFLLIKSGEKQMGVNVLKELIEQKSYATLSVLNIVDWMGAPGIELIPYVKKLEFSKGNSSQLKYLTRMKGHLINKFST